MHTVVNRDELAILPQLHDAANAHWHQLETPAPVPSSALQEVVLQQHRANFDLWHEEDEARDPKAQDSTIARVKRTIDRLNQRRNDLAESIDSLLFTAAANQEPASPLHSESPGLIIDRLSILSLKLFHTEEQVQRPEVDQAHRTRNRDRLHVLEEQRNDLAACLMQLWDDVAAGHRRFKLYRQLKMYNDPTLNPVLYRGATEHDAGQG